jgi:hypothetical protein
VLCADGEPVVLGGNVRSVTARAGSLRESCLPFRGGEPRNRFRAARLGQLLAQEGKLDKALSPRNKIPVPGRRERANHVGVF